ncbi:unannotated protein [freshwater metagenome]|uniref:Unannotated protein n=1 Tax=freshwater metagenome TaxID=449393 RepID=A0A6J6B2G4_9ZZZZ|nr:hypothetical protein [Actinomycetota bacterium]
MNNSYTEKISAWWDELHYSSLQKRGLAVVAVLVILISALFVSRGSSQEVIAAPLAVDITTVVPLLVIDVSGAVVNPGVYTLPPTSRVVDAIEAAGGLQKNADTSDINQARILKDGEQIYVYPTVRASNGTPIKRAVRKNGPIMINRASVKDYEGLDGIGPVLAQRIVTFRKVNGPFVAIEDLMKVPGIGPKTFEKFKAKLRV